ncbi:MAG: hypothetical protein EZS28_017409 [Streblomastix strix]|uniref:TOG domain-containing protein n=1 Tax=Streblomastix strix TaxID=222440 RepID=A0A5J4VWQ4_9EUKA|nr:MAG: hypothetical protein EZS28_017409 [Streblomastix strix]
MDPHNKGDLPEIEISKEPENQTESDSQNLNNSEKQNENIILNELQSNIQVLTTVQEPEKGPEISSIDKIQIIIKGQAKKKNNEMKRQNKIKNNEGSKTDINDKVQTNDDINQLAQYDEYYQWMIELEKAKNEVGISQQKIIKVSSFLKMSAQRIFLLQNNTTSVESNSMSSASCISVANRACQYLYEQSKLQESVTKQLKEMNITVDILFFLTHLPLSAISDCFISLLCEIFKDMPLQASINLFNMGVIEHLIRLLNHPYSEIREKAIESICYIICAQISNTYQLHKHPYYKGLQSSSILDKIIKYMNSSERTNTTRAYAAVILGLVHQGIQMADGMLMSVVKALVKQLKPRYTEKVLRNVYELIDK